MKEEFVLNLNTKEIHHRPHITMQCHGDEMGHDTKLFESLNEARLHGDLCGFCFKSKDNK